MKKIKLLTLGLIMMCISAGNLMAVVKIDVNYSDHGLVDLNGKVVTTKRISYLANDLSGNGREPVKRDDSKIGVKIGDYLFRVDTDSVFTVKDTKSGVVKKVALPITVENVNGSTLYTVLQGQSYDHPVYKLLVKTNCGTVIYFETNIYKAFENGEKLAVSEAYPYGEHKINGKLLSLIRVPSLDPNYNANMFNNEDFAIAVYDPYNSASDEVYIRTFQFNQENQTGQITKEKCFPDFIPPLFPAELSVISATTRVNKDGIYCVVIGFSSFHNVSMDQYAQMRIVEYGIEFDGKYSLDLNSRAVIDKELPVKYNPFNSAHFGTVVTNSYKNASSNRGYQQLAIWIPGYNPGDEWLYIDSISLGDAIFDWNKTTLDRYGVEPKVAEDLDHDAGEGMLVQGMILSVPPHPVKTITDEKLSYVTTSSTFNNYIYEGKADTYGEEKTVQLGGIYDRPSMAVGSSHNWADTTTEGKQKSITKGIKYRLDEWKYNMVIGIMPKWDFKSAVLTSKFGYNVRYANMPLHEKPYVITTAVMDESSSVEIRKSLTDVPGKGSSGKDIAVTKGMAWYDASDVSGNSNIRMICDNLRDLADRDKIEVLYKSCGKITNQAGCSESFNITEGSNFDYSTTNSWSSKMSIGLENIFSVSNTVYGSITKTSGTSTSDSKAWEFGFRSSSKSGNVSMNTVIYNIPVKALKAEFGEKTHQNKLTFIPDYMWDHGMDYWLIAYDDFGTPY